VGWDWVHLVRRPLFGLLYQPHMINDKWSSRWNENWQGKPKYSEKTCLSATLSTTNATWPVQSSNPCRGGEPQRSSEPRYSCLRRRGHCDGHFYEKRLKGKHALVEVKLHDFSTFWLGREERTSLLVKRGTPHCNAWNLTSAFTVRTYGTESAEWISLDDLRFPAERRVCASELDVC
jgi:hypothetical protein